MLSRKRDQFHTQIRRTQIEKFKQQKRKQYFNYQKQITREAIIEVIIIFDQFEKVLLTKKEEFQVDDSYRLQCVRNGFSKFDIIANGQKQKLFTFCFNDQKFNHKFLAILSQLIKNEEEYGEQNQQGDRKVWKKYSKDLRDITLLQFLKFSSHFQFFVLNQSFLIKFIDNIWEIFKENKLIYEPKMNLHSEFKYLQVLLDIFIQILDDIKPIVFQNLLNKSIGTLILQITENIKKINLPINIHHKILTLISRYLSVQTKSSSSSIPETIGSITINTNKLHQRQILYAYCICLINKKQQTLYTVAFECMRSIIQTHEFLAQNITQPYLRMIAQLILQENRSTQNEALLLLTDLIFFSTQNVNILMQKGYIFDLLHKRILSEKLQYDDQVQKNISKISEIICNCMFVQKNTVKKLALNHYIWDQIYASFHPENKMFPLIQTMHYFFDALGHKNFQKYLRPYLQNLTNFQWEKTSYAKQIKATIMHVFYLSEHWQQHEFQLLLQIYRQTKFLYLIQSYVDDEDLKQNQNIQVE